MNIHEPSSAAPTKEYVFNEAQEAWLKALESGQYLQGHDVLFDGSSYCCLGVACEISGAVFDRLGGTFFCEDEATCAPKSVMTSLKLRSVTGSILNLKLKDEVHLTDANDNGATFSEIAAFIRSNPAAVFTE